MVEQSSTYTYMGSAYALVSDDGLGLELGQISEVFDVQIYLRHDPHESDVIWEAGGVRPCAW